ncbi:MAG: glycosyl hydrolase [Anaerolineales bacterium]
MKFIFEILSLAVLVFLTTCFNNNSIPSRAVGTASEPEQPVERSAITPTQARWLTGQNIPLPPENYIYHGVFPSGGESIVVSPNALQEYEEATGKEAAWVYFSHFWFDSKAFPLETALWIRQRGSVPYLRLMMQSYFKSNRDEPLYTLQNIISGQIDDDLRAWCQTARDFGTPLIVEYGTEVNSDSFPWSGIYNGGGQTNDYGDATLPDGPERFRDAYRHIIRLCRENGADNITWVFHAGGQSYPNEAWNAFENYYPGDEWIDWLGFSAYGTHTPFSSYHRSFRAEIEDTYPRMTAIAPNKPILVAEMGSAKNNPYLDQAEWTREALEILLSGQYKNIIGFTWWNEAWQNDGNPQNDTTMRVQDNPQLQAVFQEMIGNNPFILGEISP